MTDDFRTQLLNAISSGSSRELLMQQVLQQMDADDPVREIIVKYLADHVSYDREEENGEEEAQERINRLTETLTDVSDKFERVYKEVEVLRAENKALSAQLLELQQIYEILAAALGVCPDCLGEDENCPVCSGQGYPGSGYFEPPDNLFWRFVAPALRAKRALKNHRSDLSDSEVQTT